MQSVDPVRDAVALLQDVAQTLEEGGSEEYFADVNTSQIVDGRKVIGSWTLETT